MIRRPGAGMAARRWLARLCHRATLAAVAGVLAAGAAPAAAAGPAASSALQTVRFVPERDYGPFVFADDDGRVRGLSVDLLERLAPAAGLQLQVLPAAPLAEQLARLRSGEAELVSSLRPTPERATYLAFTRPYVSVPAILVVRQGADTAAGDGSSALAALAGRSVAVGAGYAVESFVRSRYPRVAWAALPDDVQALRGVAEGRHEAAVVDAASAAFVTRRHGIAGLRAAGAIGFDYALSLAVPKSRPDLLQRLDAAIAALPLQERTEIQQRWMGSLHGSELMTPPRPPVLWVAAGLLVLAALLGGLLAWRRRARPEGGARTPGTP
ncbi:MAG: transporter substrate-binding domain-containing protein [Betaproteobacteria bacterium]